MDGETRRLTAQGLAVILVGGSIGIAGVALIVGAIVARAIIGEGRGGMSSTLVVATVVAVLTTATGLAIRHTFTRPTDLSSADRLVDERSVGGKTAWPGRTTS
jgi:hypothetical protein